MKDLFIQKEKVAALATFMDKDYTNWPKQVITTFLQTYPFLQNEPLTVTWIRKDPEKGFAVGTLNVLGGGVPVIIRDFRLSALDTIMLQGQILPLNQYTLKEVVTKPSPFKGVASSEPKGSLSLFDNFSMGAVPSDGRSYLDYTEKRAFLSQLSTVSPENMKVVAELAQKYVTDDEILSKLGQIPFETESQITDSYLRSLPVDRQLIFSDKDGNLFVKQANSTVDHTWTTPISEIEAEKLVPLMCNTQLEKIADVSAGFSFLTEDGDTIFVDESREWTKLAGNLAKPREFESDFPKIGEFGIFVDKNNKCTTPMTILGINPTSESETEPFKLAKDEFIAVWSNGDYARVSSQEKYASSTNISGNDPKVGDRGFFALGDAWNNESTAIFDIVGMQKVAEMGKWAITTFDGLKKTTFYPISMNSDKLIPHETEKNAFYVPGNARFIKLGQERKYSREKIDRGLVEIILSDGVNTDSKLLSDYSKLSFMKLGNYFEPINELQYNADTISKDDVGFYNLTGKSFEKRGMHGLQESEAAWEIIKRNGTKADLKKLSDLEKGASVKIYNLKNPDSLKTSITKLANKFEALKDISIFAKEDIEELIKAAAVIRDKTTVDSVLSLGLLGKNNIMEYVAMVPDYERLMSELSKLLIAIRLGLTQVPENAVKSCVDALVYIIEVLKQVGAVANGSK